MKTVQHSHVISALALLLVATSCADLDAVPDPASVDSAQGLTVTTGSRSRVIGVASGKCLGIKGSSTENGATIQLQGCSGSNFQNWTLARDGAGYYTMTNVGSGKCLDVTGNASATGVTLQQYGCSANDNQKWNLSDQGSGHFAIISKSSGLAVDVSGGSTTNGAAIIQYTWKGTTNQLWTLPEASTSSTSTPAVNGFAATASNGLTTTTGGGKAAVESVTTCATLKSKLEDGAARVLEIPSGTTLDCRTSPVNISACQLKCSSSSSQVFWRIPVGDQTCTSLADFNGDGTLDVPAGTSVTKQKTDFTINVNSNKTLRGAGSGATLKGVSLNIANRSNIIVQNLAFTEINPNLIEAGDGLTINTSHHIWVDHCKFSMISDGYLDIRYGSSAITVSNNHINGANVYVCGGQHNFVSLVSGSQATFHHNYFDHVGGRNPKVTDSATVHLYDNYYDTVSYFCIASNSSSQVLVENNYFYNSNYPHWVDGGALKAIGNVYAGTTSTSHRDSSGSVFTPPYSYTLEAASGLNTSIPAKAGPGK
jgi:pectate lyase